MLHIIQPWAESHSTCVHLCHSVLYKWLRSWSKRGWATPQNEMTFECTLICMYLQCCNFILWKIFQEGAVFMIGYCLRVHGTESCSKLFSSSAHFDMCDLSIEAFERQKKAESTYAWREFVDDKHISNYREKKIIGLLTSLNDRRRLNGWIPATDLATGNGILSGHYVMNYD